MIRFYVTTKMGGKDINPIREVFTASISKAEVPELVRTFIDEFNKRVTPAYKRDLISIEYEGDTDLKLFGEIEREQREAEKKIIDESKYEQIDGHIFEIVKDWYINNRGNECRNLKCRNCEVTGRHRKDKDGNIIFTYDDKYLAKKYRICNH